MILDEDQGRSGATPQARPGFARLVGAVARAEVGIVMSLEVSPLSRNDTDWHHLVHLCRWTATLFVLDASLPGGFVAGSGDMRYAQTMAFTTLMMCQLFNVFNARSDERSAFADLFANGWLWAAVGMSLVLHVAVIYLPFLQKAFSTVSLSGGDWLRCAAAASTVLWLREAGKLVAGARRTGRI